MMRLELVVVDEFKFLNYLQMQILINLRVKVNIFRVRVNSTIQIRGLAVTHKFRAIHPKGVLCPCQCQCR